MVRRRFTVRDIAKILEHWQAGRSICSISRSLGVCRSTVRKYVYAAEARGYHQGDPTPPQGWEAFLPNSYLLQDITLGLYDNAPNKDFCLHFLSKDCSGDIKFSHWS